MAINEELLKELGARARYHQLLLEMTELKENFPAINGEIPMGARKNGKATLGGPAKRGRKPMTTAERQAASVRMKKYWANKRKGSKRVAKPVPGMAKSAAGKQ